MEKLSLEKFREIREELDTVYEDQMERYWNLQNKLLSYDLSDIPFKEWDDYIIYSDENHIVDFSKTRANIDFNLVNLDYYTTPGNFKGCNVRNIFVDSILLDPNSYDDYIINGNSALFLSDRFTNDFKEKYYSKKLKMDDLIGLSSIDLNELMKKNVLFHMLITEKERFLINKYGINIFLELYSYSKDDYDFVIQVFFLLLDKKIPSSFHWNKREIWPPSSFIESKIFRADVKDMKKMCNSYLRDFILKTDYLTLSRDYPKVFVEENKDIFLLDKNVPAYLKDKYYERNLTLKQVLENLNLFDKFPIDTFIDDIYNVNTFIKDIGYGYLTNLMKKYHNFFECLLQDNRIAFFDRCLNEINGREGEEKFKEAIKRYFAKVANEEDLKAIKSTNFKVINEIKTIEDLMNYDDDTLLLDFRQYETISLFGIENLKKLEKISNFFSGGTLGFTKFEILENSVHSNSTNLNLIDSRVIYFGDGSLQYEEFEKKFAKYLEILRKNNVDLQYDYIEGKFRERYPELFISKDAPQELREAFYKNTITPKFIFGHSEYIPYLIDKNLFSVILCNTTTTEYNSSKFISLYCDKYGNRKLLELYVKYGDILDNLHIVFPYYDFDNEEFLNKSIESSIYEKIINLHKEYNYSYLKSAKDFADKHPDIFVDFSGIDFSNYKEALSTEDFYILNSNESIKEVLEEDFYSGRLRFSDIKKTPELIDKLKDKNLKCCFRNSNKKFNMKTANGYFEQIFLLDLIDLIGNEKFLFLCKEYGRYLEYIIKDLYEQIDVYQTFKNDVIVKFRETTFEEIDSKLEKILTEKCLNGKIGYLKEDAPEFLKKEHPELFLSDDAPEKLKKHFYGNENTLTFFDLHNNREWLSYLKGKSLKSALYRFYSSSDLNYLFKIFGEDTAIKLGIKKPETVSEMMFSTKRVDAMKKWYDKTGCKFIPDCVVMKNIPVEDADKFLLNTTNWNKLMKLEEYSRRKEVRDAMLKVAYSFGVFDSDKRGFNKLYNLLTKIPKKISNNTYNQIKGFYFDQRSKFIEKVRNGETFTTTRTIYTEKFLIDFEKALKEEIPNIDCKKEIISQLYRKNEDNTYSLVINQQNCPKTIQYMRKILLDDTDISLTPEKLHQLFGGFKIEYNAEFREFLLDNLEEILSNPDYLSYITSIQKQFNDIKIANSNRKLTLPLAISYVQENRYEDVEVGNESVAEISAIAGYTQEDFITLQKIYNYGKQRVFSSIPRIENNTDKYSYEMLRLDDPLAMAIGTLTDCCQELGNAAESCMEHSMVDNNGRVFVIRDSEGNIVSQSWVWRNKNVLCFDNIEIPNKAFTRVENRRDFTEKVYEIYKKAADELIKRDKEVYKKLLNDAKITKEQYNGLVLSKVTVGIGYNDIASVIGRNAIEDTNIVRPLPFKEKVGLDDDLYTSDSTVQYILEEEKDRKNYKGKTIQVHNDLYEIYDDTNFTQKELFKLAKLETNQSGYSDIMDEVYDTKDNLVSSIGDFYDLNKENTRIIMNANFALIYEEKEDEIVIGDLFYNTNVGEEKKDIESIVIMQLRLALDQIGKNKKIDTSNLEKEQMKIFEKAINLKEELDVERGLIKK